MKINCQERYDEVLEYAKSINDETFQDCINRLKTWEENAKEQGRDMEIHLFRDHEPKSFFFREVYADGRNGICGGVLYHGVPGERDNSMAVCIDGRAYGWRIHT